MPTQRGIPASFWLAMVFGLMIAGVIATAGFAIAKDDEVNNSQVLREANERAVEQYLSGGFTAPPEGTADPAIEMIPEDQRPAPGEAAEGGGEGEGGEVDLPEVEVDEDALLSAADTSQGEELYFANGCNACHGDVGEGGVGPTIAKTGLTLSQEVGQYRTPRGTMLQFPENRISDQEVAHIYAWLQSLPTPETPAGPPPAVPPNE